MNIALVVLIVMMALAGFARMLGDENGSDQADGGSQDRPNMNGTLQNDSSSSDWMPNNPIAGQDTSSYPDSSGNISMIRTTIQVASRTARRSPTHPRVKVYSVSMVAKATAPQSETA